MTYKEIANLPTSISLCTILPAQRYQDIHESQFRAAAILDKVKDLLDCDTAPRIVLELIELMESDDFNHPQTADETDAETSGVSHLRKAENPEEPPA